MESMSGFLGERMLVNGQAQPSLSLATRAYRFRLLNGSNSRVYKLAWGDGTPMTVIGTDGGLLEQPLGRPYLTLVPGERADVILDLSRHPVGTSLQLSRAWRFPARHSKSEWVWAWAWAGVCGAAEWEVGAAQGARRQWRTARRSRF